MELSTPRLRMRRWRQEDREPLFRINDEPEVKRYLPPQSRAGTDEMVDWFEDHFAEHGFGFWALEERESGALIGICGLLHVPFDAFFTPAVEIGWRLSGPWQKQGLAREAAEAALRFGFGPAGLRRIVAFTTPLNAPSWTLMRRLGMREIGRFDYPELPEGHALRPSVVYEIEASFLA